MRRILIILSMVLLSAVLFYGNADAAVSGQCSNCHTMHNSQNGSPMAKKFDGTDETTAQPNLTRSTCLGCHNGQAPGAPNIFGTTSQTAAGSFDTGTGYFDNQAKGHNVQDLVSAGLISTDTVFDGKDAPGKGSDSTIAATANNLNCAGATGCHGDHDSANTTSMKGIKGFHHAASTGYRFLQTSTGTAILGVGEADWEKGGATTSKHNLYSADGSAGISVLCAQCHGGFHGTGDTGSSSPFTRHPTENAVSDLTQAGDVDVLYNPFAFTSFTGMSTTDMTNYTWANGKVMCLSCHRAHATGENDILRFDYDAQIAGTGANVPGCLGCHKAQR